MLISVGMKKSLGARNPHRHGSMGLGKILYTPCVWFLAGVVFSVCMGLDK
jgi:hypothetical protein